MSTSFPYLAIAKRFGMPYSGVATVATMHANYAYRHPECEWRDIHAESSDVQTAIYQAFVAERARRQAIYAEMAS